MLATAVVARSVPVVAEAKLEMGREVRWLTDLPEMPTVGRIIGVQERFVGTEMQEVRYHVDFDTTRLWIGGHELRPIV